MKIKSKGQVTLPLVLRRELGWNQNKELDKQLTKDGILFKPKAKVKTRGQKLVQRLAGKAGKKWATDQLMALTRG